MIKVTRRNFLKATHIKRLTSNDESRTRGKFYAITHLGNNRCLYVDDKGRTLNTRAPEGYWDMYSEVKVLDLTGVYHG